MVKKMMVPIKKEISKKTETKKSKRSFVFTTVYILAGLSILFLITAAVVSKNKTVSSSRQAVFMTSGQVYFGYVEDKKDPMVVINDVYYITGASALYPEKSEDKISLIKMGTEVYKPMASISVNRDQILMIQDISSESQINEAIKSSLNKK